MKPLLGTSVHAHPYNMPKQFRHPMLDTQQSPSGPSTQMVVMGPGLGLWRALRLPPAL